METIFSKQLAQARKNAGFPTAYRFYHDNGGQGVLKLTYRNYLRLEQGLILPVPEKLGVLIFALRLAHGSPEANGLVVAWLKTMTGPDAYRDLVEPLLAARAAAPALAPAEAALKSARLKRTYYINPAQYSVLCASYENFLCCHYTNNDTGNWTAPRLAALLGVTAAVADKALKALTGVKLLKETKKGVYKCLITDQMRMLPDKRTLPAEQVKRYAGFLDRLAAEGGPVLQRRMVLRADGPAFRNFLPSLEAAVLMADSYSVHQETGASALYVVDGTVTKVRDF